MASVAAAVPAEHVTDSVGTLPSRMQMVWEGLPTAAQSRLQMAWDLETKKSDQIHKIYKKTVALLLSWKNSDLETSEEVKRLRGVLEKTYQFTVVETLLDKTGGHQKQLNAHLASFVNEHDTKDTLLLIYYAGHGWRKKNKDDENMNDFFLIERITAANAVDHGYNQVAWDSAERILEHADGDILGIFDCCNAGHLSQFRRAPLRFEYLGACGSDQTTQGPGPDSFTSALIWALEQLSRDGPFSTSALQRKIIHAPKFPKKQVPHLGPRLCAPTDFIMLAPHELPKETGSSDKQSNAPKPSIAYDSFDLRIYVTDMSEQVITAWAKAMNRHASNKDLKMDRCDFRGTNVSRCLDAWSSRARRSTEIRLNQPTDVSFVAQEQFSDPSVISSHLELPADRNPMTPSSSRCESQLVSGDDIDNDSPENVGPGIRKRKRNGGNGRSKGRREKRSSRRRLAQQVQFEDSG